MDGVHGITDGVRIWNWDWGRGWGHGYDIPPTLVLFGSVRVGSVCNFEHLRLVFGVFYLVFERERAFTSFVADLLVGSYPRKRAIPLLRKEISNKEPIR